MPRPRKTKEKRPNPKAYTLQTQIVINYIEFLAVRGMGLVKKIMPEDCQTEEAFLIKHGLSPNSDNTLRNYENILGFWNEVEKSEKKYKHYLRTIGMTGLLKRAEGLVIVEQALDRTGNVHDLDKELPPDVKASERLVQLGGGEIKDTVEVSGLASRIQEAVGGDK